MLIAEARASRRGRPDSRKAEIIVQQSHSLRTTGIACAFAVAVLFTLLVDAASAQAPRFRVTIPANAAAEPITGRLVLILARSAQPEPRLTLSPHGPAILGLDLEAVPPGGSVVLDSTATSYPVDLNELEPGEYFAQPVINVYEQVHRADGHTLWLPMNDGRIEFFTNARGNLYGEPVPVRVGGGGTIELVADRIIPQGEPPADTDWIRRVTIRSERLSEFWGRPIHIHATVLLPSGYDANPEVRYPTIFSLGHSIPFGFNPDSTRFRNLGTINPVSGVETGFDFYRSWTSDDFPRFIAVSLEQQTPYFPDSYSVNSANNGPYGDAVIHEVIPELERQFRMIGEPYARILEGASTSGWQSLALILRNPEFFGGAWILQPDPIDFTRYQLTNVYEDENAFFTRAGELTVERPFRRTVEGQPVWTVRQLTRFEQVLGSRGRSGYQLQAWEAIYGPTDEDGYPRPLWDPVTGEIDREVARSMRDNGYDLRAYAQANWSRIGPHLAGKLHFHTPDMDDFYLNLAVYRFEEFLANTTNPRSDARFTYGRPMKGHSWHVYTWADLLRRIATHVRRHAPRGADTEAWRR